MEHFVRCCKSAYEIFFFKLIFSPKTEDTFPFPACRFWEWWDIIYQSWDTLVKSYTWRTKLKLKVADKLKVPFQLILFFFSKKTSLQCYKWTERIFDRYATSAETPGGEGGSDCLSVPKKINEQGKEPNKNMYSRLGQFFRMQKTVCGGCKMF